MLRRIVFLTLLLGTVGCGPRQIVVLLPDPDGNVGKISVTTAQGTQTLDVAKSAIEIASGTDAPSPPRPMQDEELERVFSSALAAEPPPPLTFQFYFVPDTAIVIEESEPSFSQLVYAIAGREHVELVVVGHTDPSHSEETDLQLSLRRAEAVRDILAVLGVASDVMEVLSFGDSKPLIPAVAKRYRQLGFVGLG